MKKERRKVKWRVGISKIYFPPEIRPRTPGDEFFEIFEVMAHSRTEAANLVWKSHRERWLNLMGKPQTSCRVVRLHVSYPGGKWVSRLEPIRVI